MHVLLLARCTTFVAKSTFILLLIITIIVIVSVGCDKVSATRLNNKKKIENVGARVVQKFTSFTALRNCCMNSNKLAHLM